ncbi:MAG: BatA domain-containing protein [Verrucomicrobiota bacterium]
MSQFFLNPWMFWGGLLAVLLPIIIHLLNKRRFKRVEWAAMDFLLEANKLNKRRIKMEELLLLLLRCLAMLLLGLLLARPFLQSSGRGLLATPQFERVIIFDDSLSMNAQSGGTSPLREARRMLGEWISGLTSGNSEDSITFLLTSNPTKPVFNGVPLTEGSAGEVLEEIKNLEVAHGGNNLLETLRQVEKDLAAKSGNLNRVVYLFSDMRESDWTGETAELIKRLTEKTSGFNLVDLAPEATSNLLLESITPREKALIAGVTSGFDVTVRNLGEREVTGVTVRFSAANAAPLEGQIERIAPGGTASVPFTYTFPRAENEDDRGLLDPLPLKAEIALKDGSPDLLNEDNVSFFPARLSRGLKTLIVDGDPSGTFGGSESFFLRRALAPRGDALSGVEVTTVDDNEFQEVDLEEFQVIYLANLYRLTDLSRERLEAWVQTGGGLVLALGDQVDEDHYNTEVHREGAGLLPMKLGQIQGDETEETWAFFDLEQEDHPILRIFEGANNPLLEGVKTFRWWDSTIETEVTEGGDVQILARFTDDAKSPALVEKAFGKGRVIAITTSLDADWNNWPQEGASFLIAMQEMSRYVAQSTAKEGLLASTDPLQQTVDLKRYRPEAELEAPGNDIEVVEARPPSGASPEETEWVIQVDDQRQSGFYALKLQPVAGGDAETALFAANPDPAESDLRRIDAGAFAADLGDSGVQLFKAGQSLMNAITPPARSEVWKWILYALILLLCLELFYGWWLGARR